MTKKPTPDLEAARPGRIGKQTPVDQNSERSHNVDIKNKGHGGSINQVGVSERTLVLFVLVPLAVTLAAAFAAVAIAAWNGGATSGAVYAAQMAERNAKLAQYQLEEAIKKIGEK